MISQIPVLIVVIPLLLAFVCPLIGLWRKEGCYFWAILTLSLCALAAVDTLFAVLENGVIRYRMGNWAPPFGIEYYIDHLNAMMLVLISGISLLVVVYSRPIVVTVTTDLKFFAADAAGNQSDTVMRTFRIEAQSSAGSGGGGGGGGCFVSALDD